PREEMNAEKFRAAAVRAMKDISARGKSVFVVGGSGLYVKALTHGFSPLPPASGDLRERLDQLIEDELFVRLGKLDPVIARTIDARNKRRLIRAVEICLLTGRPASAQRNPSREPQIAAGVILSRNREDLYSRINARVEVMFREGVVQEVAALRDIGPTAAKTIGLAAIRRVIAGEISEAACIAQIQQATRRYAKRQLTWFQRQTNFEPLNLSLHGTDEAIELIARKARLSFAQKDV
ncbi:MAG: hypothetical protein M3Z22_04610, partial [Verrucomicrobiota bacterium]|nr:hypothetical protein [Verrucomicrobiota bacterium]